MKPRPLCLTLAFISLLTTLFLAPVATARPLAHDSAHHLQSQYPGVRLTTVAGRPVFASMLNHQVSSEVCPRLPLPVSPRAVRQAAVVVARALLPLLAHAARPGNPKVDATGAKTSAMLASKAHSGEDFRRFCGEPIWVRSMFVVAHLPKVKTSASLSVLSFLIADTARGWIIWGEVH